MAALGTMISMAITRPCPPTFGSNDWHMMPSSTSESWARICGCWCAGNTAMTRLIVEHGRSSGGPLRAGRAGNQNEPAGLFAKLGDYRRQTQLRERLDLERDHAKHRGGGPALIKKIATEARQTFQSEREVEFQIFFEAMLLGIGKHAVGELLGLGRRQ